MTLTQGGLFEGYGGLSMAVAEVLGADLAWYSEHEPATKSNPKPTQAAARLLAYRHPGVPNLGDITAIDWATVPPVDVLTGGFPCQDVSLAGQRRGIRPDSRSEGHVTAVPGLTRNEQLGRLGNGVVPQQAAAALRHLLDVS